MPITCKTSQLDYLGLVLYGAHGSLLDQTITASGKRCAALYKSEHAWHVAEFATRENTARNVKIAAFFFLLNMDPTLRENIPIACPHKAGRLYQSLHESVVPGYLKNERIDLCSFVESLQSMYRNE